MRRLFSPRCTAALLAALCVFCGGLSFAKSRRASGPLTPAESPDDATLRQAQQSIEKARTALLAHDTAAAYRHAADSFRLVASPEALLWLGRVAQAENRTLDAQDLFRRYLADPNLELAADSPDQQEAQRSAEKPRPKSGQLNVLGDRGTLVQIDGRLVGALPLSRPILLSVSEHKIELLRGNRRLEDEVRVPIGRLAEVRAELSTRALLLSVLPGVVVLDQFSGFDDAGRRRIESTLEQAVQAERLSPLPRELAFDVAGEPDPGPCKNERRCLLDLADKCEADYVLRVRVQKSAADWKLRMELVDVEVGDVAQAIENTCTGCDLDQAAQRLSGLFSPLYKQASSRARGHLEVTSVPSDAEVLIDGQSVGNTPYKATVWAGARQLLIRQKDYQEEQRELVVRDGENAELKVRLKLLPEPPPALIAPKKPDLVLTRGPRPRWRIGLGVTSLAVGALFIGLGASGLSVNGQCLGGQPAVGQCLKIYDTLAPGIGLSVSGGVLLGVGVGLLSWPGPLKKAPAPAESTTHD